MYRAFIALLALASLCSSLDLNCVFRTTSWTVIGSQYTCDGTIVFSDFAEYKIDSVSGSHTNGRSNVDVKVVNILEHPGLNRIASNIEEFFPNIIGLRWFSGNLTWVDANDFKPFPELQLISLRQNLLVSLDGDLFKFNPKLRFISFRENLLQNVGHDLLTNLTSLAQAAFSNNPCINVFATNPHAIEALNLQLPIDCPPLPETTVIIPEECPNGCEMRIDSLEEEILLETETLKKQIEEQNIHILEVQKVVDILKEQIEELRNELNEIRNNSSV